MVAGLFLAAHFAAWLPSLSMTTVAASVAIYTVISDWIDGRATVPVDAGLAA